jgi:hypothetical protein
VKHQTRILLTSSALLLALIVVLTVARAALAQRSASSSFGCWGIFSSGGGEQTSVQSKMLAAITPLGGSMQGVSFRIDANHFTLWTTLNPQPGPVAPPVQDVGMQYLPAIFGQILHLDRLCTHSD